MAAAQRGRFQEGSMNDRVSAAPPLQFLGPQEREALEMPAQVQFEGIATGAGKPSTSDERPSQPQTQTLSRKGGKMLLGQVWEGMRGRLRLGRDGDRDTKKRSHNHNFISNHYNDLVAPATTSTTATTVSAMAGSCGKGDDGERPTREEVFESYQHLVASGFFSSHAIYSTRQPGPRPSTSHETRRHGNMGGTRTIGEAPQWPLAPYPVRTPKMAKDAKRATAASPVCSPVSASSSRGTKRAVEEDNDTILSDNDADADDADENGDDASTLAHRFLPKRLRKAAARDISLPRLRSVASRKNMRAAARRSISTGAHYLDSSQTATHKESNKLIKRTPLGPFAQELLQQSKSRQQDRDQTQTRGSLDSGVPSGRRNVSETGSVGVAGRKIRKPISLRNLRGRHNAGAEPLSVIPDAKSGIPSVPAIPVKFTYGEDRENGEPWRGLRR